VPRSVDWSGVLPAVTTPFAPDLAIDVEALAGHCRWLVDSGCTGVVVGGSLGEGATLDRAERTAIVRAAADAIGDRAPVIAAVGGTRTSEAVDLARAVAHAGAAGLLLLPPYVYRGDRRETLDHFGQVLRATERPCMLYNNPIAYGTDVDPELLLDLATEHPTLQAVKESSGDVRRISAIRALLGRRLAIAVGVDDLVLEGLDAGATGWIAGLANAFPTESVELYERGMGHRRREAFDLYRWFLPLLRMDSSPKFVQLIKFVQAETGHGAARVRPPRLELEGAERSSTLETLRTALAHRPKLDR
jgi:1-pyrroline-4-hydroxy-2-carboxylate deaminase